MWKVSAQNYLSFQFREAKHEKAFGKYHTYCLNLSFFNKIRPFNIQHQHFPVSTLFLQITAQNYFYSLILSFYFFATIWPSSYFHLFCISSDHVDMEQNTRITVAFLSSRRLNWNKAASLLAFFSFFPDPNDAVWSLISSLAEGIFACSVCSHTSRNRRAMYEHVEAKHTKSPGYPCTLCPGRVRPSLNALRSHTVRHHGSSRGFVPK